MSVFIDVHALQTLPPSNINRDDTGSPKTATFGGVVRQRVSSQAWKHAIRDHFNSTLDISQQGLRTKRVVEKIADAIKELDPSGTDAERFEAAKNALSVAKIKVVDSKKKRDEDEEAEVAPEVGYLLFISTLQIKNLARLIVEAGDEKLTKKAVSEAIDQDHSVDIAAFGRMVADAPAFNVDAAVQVAHSIGIHESEPEFDYFTAVDDVAEQAEESGAGMIGTIQMMSSTLYRYATVDLDGLKNNLGDADAAVVAATAFVNSFILSMPTGKQNTFANRTLPEVVYVSVRRDRPISLVNAFEEPVSGETMSGRRSAATDRMVDEALAIASAYGTEPVYQFAIAIGSLGQNVSRLCEPTSLPDVLDGLRGALEREIS